MDYNAVNHQIYMTGVELRSNYTDGFNQWELKKDIYKIKWLVDDILKNSPTFSDEDEFVKEHEQLMIVRELER